MRNRIIPALSYILGLHLANMSRMMTESRDTYLDIGRELKFFVAAGYYEYLSKNKKFKQAWEDYSTGRDACPNDVILQDWKFNKEMDLLAMACGIYTKKGLLMRSEIPFDDPNASEDGEESEEAEVPA